MIICPSPLLISRTLAGFPATIVWGGTSLVTTLPAPTSASSPTVTLERIGHARTERCALADAGLFHFPVGLGLQRAVFVGGAGIAVVDEHHPVADENVVFDGHAFADEGVAGNLAVLADGGVFLNLDKSADLGVIADFAAVEIDELRKLYVFPQLHARGDTQVFIHSWNLFCAHVFVWI